MALLQPASRRRSSLIALTTVAAALSAAPKAQAQIPDTVYWGGGIYDGWGVRNWFNVSGAISDPKWQITNAIFGFPTGGQSRFDNNGIVTNDVKDRLNFKGLAFYNQPFTVRGQSFRLINRDSYINVETSSQAVTIENDIYFDVFGPRPQLSLDVADSATLTMAGSMYGLGALYKADFGTAILAGFHNYTEGTNVIAGRLIDYHPHGNYRVESLLEFHIDDNQTSIGNIFGSGALEKSGAGTLTLGANTTHDGGTLIDAGRLIDQNPHGEYFFKPGAALEFRTTGTRTFTGSINGAGSLIKSGAGTLTVGGGPEVLFTRGTTVDEGRLIDVKPHGSYVTNAILEFQPSQYGQVDGTISGTGSVIKQGSSTLVLSGLNTYTGGTTVLNGLLVDSNPHGAYEVNGALEFRTTGDKTYSGFVSGNGTLTKSGDGVLIVTNANHTGGTTVDGGRLIDLNPHGNYRTDADLELRNSDTVDLRDAPIRRYYSIGGTGNFTKSGDGALLLWAANTYGGSTTINGGVVVANRIDNVLPTTTALTVNANFVLSDNLRQTVASLAGRGAVSLGSGSSFTVNGTESTTFSGSISNYGSLTKTGTGTLTLTGGNYFLGGTTVNGGRLIAHNPYGAYATNDTGVLEFRTATARDFSSLISGTGAFAKSGAGTLTLSGDHSYTGGTAVDEGRLIDLSPKGDYGIAPGAILEFQTADFVSYDGSISGNGSFVKSGSGALGLNAASSYLGSTAVADGALVSYVGDALPTSTALTVGAAGRFVLTGTKSQRIASLAGEGSVETSFRSTLTVDGDASTTFGGTISGIGSLAKFGASTLTLSGANAYTGGTGVYNGRLIDLNPHGDYFLGAALEFQTAGEKTYSGLVTGFGSLTKSGAGTLTMTKAPANTNGVRVSGGALSVEGGGAFGGGLNGSQIGDGLTVDSGATFRNASGATVTVAGESLLQGGVATTGGSTTAFTGLVSGSGGFTGLGTVDFQGGYSPGNSPASVRFDGNLKLSSSLQMELGGTALGTGYDHLTVDGTAFLGGALDVVYLNGFSASLGQSFDLFDFQFSNGAFSSISLPTLGNDLVWNTSALYSNGTISVQAVPEPASLAALGLGAFAVLRRRKRA